MKIVKGLPREAKPGELVALDLETFGQERPHRPGGTFAALSIAYETGPVYLIADKADLREAVSRTQAGTWVMQNALYDLRMLRHWLGSISQRYVHDTMLVDMDLFGGLYSLFGLGHLSRRHLEIFVGKDLQKEFITATEFTPELEEYAATDSWVTVRIARKQLDYIAEELGGEIPWYTEIDEPCIWAVLDMAPVRLDGEAWAEHADEMAAIGENLQEKLGTNVKSQPQVNKLLDRDPKETTAAGELERLRDDAIVAKNKKRAELIQTILDIRAYRDAASKYGRNWLKYLEGEYVYPAWKVVGAPTGRMAVDSPPMQQVPIRERPEYREFILASPGGRLLVSDVNQQEPRALAQLSKDEALLQELKDGEDLHAVTARHFNVPRPQGKTINLGLNYGMSAVGLARQTGITEREAEDGMRVRRMHYRGVTAWQDRMRRQAERLGYITTTMGRPMWVNPYDWQHERHAINAPVQGTAADQTKLALRYIHEECEAQRIPFMVNLVVHDEIVVDAPKGTMPKYRQIVEEAWKEAGRKTMPLVETVVELASGPTWRVK